MKKILTLSLSHVVALAVGFAVGVYTLPILTAPKPPAAQTVRDAVGELLYEARFVRELRGSDFLHWGEGRLYIGRRTIAFLGRLAPGPDYKLYLSPGFVETETEFNQLKSQMIRVGDVKSFENFIVALPTQVDPRDYNTAIVWCETFEQFISAAQYQ